MATAALSGAVVAHLGRQVFVAAAQADMHVEGLVERHGELWRAHLRVHDRDGTPLGVRELQTRDGCAALVEELALVIALLVEPSVSPAVSKEATAPPRTGTGTRERTRTVLLPVVIESRTAARGALTSWRLDAGFAWAAGLMPAVSPGLVVRAAVRPPGFWGVALDGGFWPEGRADTQGGRAAHFTAAYGGAALCPLWVESGRLAATGCAGLQAGTLIARGTGFDVDSSGARWMAQGSMVLDGSLRILGAAALWTGVGLGVPLRRDRFLATDTAGGSEELHRMSPLVGWLGVGLGVSLPQRL
jgi:hypothetical protein